LKERPQSRKERARFETKFCFDDTFVKIGADERLLASDKGVYWSIVIVLIVTNDL